MKFGKKLHSFSRIFFMFFLLTIFTGMYSEKADAASVSVNSWAGFVEALQNTDVSEINLTGNVTKLAAGNPSPGTISRDLTINGNGYTINFLTGTTNPGNGIILGDVTAATTLTLNNVDFHKYTTPATATFSGAGTNWTINLNSVTTGTQTTAAQSALLNAAGATVNISGTTKLRMQSSTDTPHIKAASLNILEGANVTFAQSSNRHGGAFQGNTVTVGKDATVDLGAWTNNGTSSYYTYGLNAETSVVMEEGSTVKAGSISANYTRVINTGSFTAKANSSLEVSTTSTYTSIINATGDVTLEAGAQVTGSNTGNYGTQINAAGAVNVLSGATLNLTASGTNTTQVKSGAEEFLVRAGSNINVNYTYGSNTTSYSFYVNKFVVEDNAVFKHVASGTGHRIFATGMTIGKGADVEISTTSTGGTDANIYLENNAKLLVEENAVLTINNPGNATTVSTTGSGTNITAGAAGSHGIYGSIADFTIEPNATVNIDVSTVGYWTRFKNSLTMSGGAVLNSHSKNREAVLLSYDFGDGEHADKPATINITGEGTKLNMTSGNTGFTAQEGSTMRVQGDGSVFNLTDGAEIYSKNDRSSALQMQSQNSVFNVKNGAKIHLIKETKSSTTNYNLGAALRFRIRGYQTFNIDNAEVLVESSGTGSNAIRLYGNDNAVNVTNGGKLLINNYGNGGSANDGGDGGKGGIQYTSANNNRVTGQVFNLSGKGSTVDIYAAEGPAIVSTGTYGDLTANVLEGTNFVLEGRTSSANSGGAIQVTNSSSPLIFNLDAPNYFDMRNNRSSGGYVLEGSGTSVMTATRSDLSVWKTGSNLAGNPFRSWSIFDYKLTGQDFVTISYTNVPDEFNTNADSYGSIGARAYSRMSANNASAIIDELRIPTNADKYIYGHASVPEGLDEIRDAWTDEVYVEVQVKNADGTPAFKTTGVSVGIDAVNNGLSVYGEEARGGMFVIPIPDGKFVTEGMTAEVIAAWRGAADSESDRVHTSSGDEIQTGVVTSIDVTPPTQVVSPTSMNNATKQITGTSDENGAKVFVKVNDEWLKDDNGDLITTVVANGSWTINLPRYLNDTDVVDVYLKDNTVINPEPTYALPTTYTQEPDGVYGNLNENPSTYTSYIGYHDAINNGTVDERFDSALRFTTVDIIPNSLSVEKTVKVFRDGNEVASSQVGDTAEYTLITKNNTNFDTTWSKVILTDTLAEGLDFDLATAEVKINDVAAPTTKVNYEEATKTLSVDLGDIPSGSSVKVTFKTTVNQKAAGQDVLNKGTATGYSPRETPFVAGPVNPNADHEVLEQESNTTILGNVYGILSLTSAPRTIDFGTNVSGSYGDFKAVEPSYDQPLVVTDSRASLSSWTLTAKVTKVMTSSDDDSYILPDALVYKSDDGEEILGLNQPKIITSHTHSDNGAYDVSQEEWENKENGFLMKLSASDYRKMGEYRATILFTVGDTP